METDRPDTGNKIPSIGKHLEILLKMLIARTFLDALQDCKGSGKVYRRTNIAMQEYRHTTNQSPTSPVLMISTQY